MSTSESQKRASRNWESRNRSKATIQSYRRTAKMFIRNHADHNDLEELKSLIKERESKFMYLVNIELVKKGKIVEVNFDHNIATTETREEALSAIEEDKINYTTKEADELIYSIVTATKEEIEEGEYDLDTDDVIEINLKGGDTVKDKMTLDNLMNVYFDEGNNTYDLDFQFDGKTVVLSVSADDHEEAAQNEDYFEDEGLIDDLVEDAKEEDIEVK